MGAGGATRVLKCFFFVGLLAGHAVLAWNAFKFNWLFIEIATIWPALVLRLEACYSIVCMPSSVGWGLCFVLWAGTHYLIAVGLSKLLAGQVAQDQE